jgi:hypothetical protein
MKRILLSVCLISIACFYGFSQGLSLTDTLGNPIAANSTLVMNGTPDVAELVTHLWVKNNGGHVINVKAKKAEVSLLSGSNVTFCWAGNCFPPNVYESIGTTAINAGETATEFSGHYAPSLQKGQTKVEWTFWDVADPTNTVTVTVDYNTYPVGKEELTAARLTAAFPNPASNNVSIGYSLPSGSEGKIVVRNILGVEVRSESIQAGSGKFIFNVSDLSEGIYFYSLIFGGQSTSTGKLVVKH